MIAIELDITEGTVKVHLKHLLRKLGVSNRTQAALWARNQGLES
jgi:two-component system nitrate/nitrite response regulator NarL